MSGKMTIFAGRMRTRVTYILLLALTLATAACDGGEEEHGFDIRGAWVLDRISKPDGSDFSYSQREVGVPIRIFTDSCYYVAKKLSEHGQFAFTPTYNGRYKLIDKGGGEWLYFEDGAAHGLFVMNDSTFVIRDACRTTEWHRAEGDDFANAGDFTDMLGMCKDTWDDGDRTYVFTERERTLKSRNHGLTAIILCVVMAMAFLAYFTRNIYLNKKRIEQQLRQIREESDARPAVVREALRCVEDEFLHSDFYMSLRKRISAGARLTQSDWDEIERRTNATYAGFTSRLFNLYPMSRTELQTCLLIKLGVPASEIASTLSKDNSTISSIRSRLYTKVFHTKGGAKEWDEFILSL